MSFYFILKTRPDPIRAKILELIQCWSHAFKKNPNYKIVEDFYNAMKLEGFLFPVLKEADALFEVDEAPQWIHDSESKNCYRCRTEFSTLRRRHHCRACGQIFCHACSSKTSPIPKFGIEKEVRVCDVCFDKINTNTMTQNESDLPIEYLNSALYKEAKAQQAKSASGQAVSSTSSGGGSKSNEKTEEEFEEELQLALALSQSEIEHKKSKQSESKSSKSNSKKSNLYSSLNTVDSSQASAPYYDSVQSPVVTNQTKQQLLPSNPTTTVIQSQNVQVDEEEDQEEVKIDTEIDSFIIETKKILELYINRMKSDSMRGRSITNDTAVQSLFIQLQHLQPKLLSYIKYKEDARAYYENLQDKLTQLKDAREALNALRQENYEKKRREMEERERLRQMQINQKLQAMRQQKHSYYMYQNQLNLQRLQEQERDLQMRLNQQRELVLQRDQQLSGFVNASGSVMPTQFGNGQLPINPQDPMFYQQQQQQPGFMTQPQWTQQQQFMPVVNGVQQQQLPQQVVQQLPQTDQSQVYSYNGQYQAMQQQYVMPVQQPVPIQLTQVQPQTVQYQQPEQQQQQQQQPPLHQVISNNSQSIVAEAQLISFD
jgi:growth factor-regulated tyrosine kinase substrate